MNNKRKKKRIHKTTSRIPLGKHKEGPSQIAYGRVSKIEVADVHMVLTPCTMPSKWASLSPGSPLNSSCFFL
jgi:hypothetical protein